MFLLGYDIGSSSIKASLLNAETGEALGSAFFPKKEMEMQAVQPGWAEQHPDTWWENLKAATAEVLSKAQVDVKQIKAIGISYQMHGLVIVDKNQKVLRPSIIWCDSRAVNIGNTAFENIGKSKCLDHLLNSPGNFTASKLKWVKDNESETYAKIHKAMLPGDFIAMKMTGEITTTSTGLSEGILWDFKEEKVASILLDQYGISADLIPTIVPVFSNQGTLTADAAKELGLNPGTVIAYRGGDQPNNAFSLNVLKTGEVAATAGTSGVIYGVSDKAKYDEQSRVNTFVHVNHTAEAPKYGVLLCVNGTGILNSWTKNNLLGYNKELTYPEMNDLAAKAPIGSNGLSMLPFGNGAERILGNKEIGAQLSGLRFNSHNLSHVLRAAQEGIVFSLNYGLEIMKGVGVSASTIKAGEGNMFLSPIFSEAFATLTGAVVELYKTDGSQGAARAAGYGAGIYKSLNEAFIGLNSVRKIEPKENLKQQYQDAYNNWLQALTKHI
ncbi:MAG: FGGY family carbohydrate kinase [Bacteroidetes bacterium]|nr:FGGY family carbohydrate kinase [Bacteroidota bacterium]